MEYKLTMPPFDFFRPLEPPQTHPEEAYPHPDSYQYQTNGREIKQAAPAHEPPKQLLAYRVLVNQLNWGDNPKSSPKSMAEVQRNTAEAVSLFPHDIYSANPAKNLALPSDVAYRIIMTKEGLYDYSKWFNQDVAIVEHASPGAEAKIDAYVAQ